LLLSSSLLAVIIRPTLPRRLKLAHVERLSHRAGRELLRYRGGKGAAEPNFLKVSIVSRSRGISLTYFSCSSPVMGVGVIPASFLNRVRNSGSLKAFFIASRRIPTLSPGVPGGAT